MPNLALQPTAASRPRLRAHRWADSCMIKPIAALTLLALFLSGTEAGTVPCLEYKSQVVDLRGALAVETVPGPPGFKDLAKGDRPEPVWILTLFEPICVSADSADELDRAVPTANRLQVGFVGRDGYMRYESMLGHDVVVSGTLVPAHTIHHHTEVLIMARSIKRITRT